MTLMTMCQLPKEIRQTTSIKERTQLKAKIPHLDSLFSAAMKDAENPTPNKISHNLRPIIGNKDLIDTLIEGERYVKMVSWKGNPAYYPSSGKYNTSKYDMWVTAAPFVQDSCISFHKRYDDPDMRLKQLLGLQPFNIETFFLEVWVKPSDLFRPCPDSETGDTRCGLNLPDNTTDEYRKWFNNLRAVQYTDCSNSTFHQNGYPWTQLGYTYDWSPDSKNHIGLSEFVINRNTDIYVSGKYSTKNYCSASN